MKSKSKKTLVFDPGLLDAINEDKEFSWIKDDKGEDITNCFLNDLINSALSEVNWQELAEGYVQENGTVFNQESVEEEV